MTFATDQKRVAYFLDAFKNTPAYNCPSRGTVVLKVDGVVVHEGRESLLSWTNRHFAKVEGPAEQAARKRQRELDAPYVDFMQRQWILNINRAIPK